MMSSSRSSSSHTYRKMYFTTYDSPLGEMFIAADGKAISRVSFRGQKYLPSYDSLVFDDDLTIFKDVKGWLDDYFNGLNPKIDFELKPKGSEFQLRVWRILCRISYGETMTYGEIARMISPTMSAQAVGGAVGRNPISIIIPCHRVLGAKGQMTGYAAGIDRKVKLLELEKII